MFLGSKVLGSDEVATEKVLEMGKETGGRRVREKKRSQMRKWATRRSRRTRLTDCRVQRPRELVLPTSDDQQASFKPLSTPSNPPLRFLRAQDLGVETSVHESVVSDPFCDLDLLTRLKGWNDQEEGTFGSEDPDDGPRDSRTIDREGGVEEGPGGGRIRSVESDGLRGRELRRKGEDGGVDLDLGRRRHEIGGDRWREGDPTSVGCFEVKSREAVVLKRRDLQSSESVREMTRRDSDEGQKEFFSPLFENRELKMLTSQADPARGSSILPSSRSRSRSIR